MGCARGPAGHRQRGRITGHIIGAVGSILRAAIVNLFVGQQLTMIPTTWSRDDLLAVTELADAGTLRPVIERTYPLIAPLRHCSTSKKDTHAARSSSRSRKERRWRRRAEDRLMPTAPADAGG